MSGDALRHIADRIDREHRMAMEKVAAEVDALPMTDESMAEHGWYRALDGDKVPVRIGDEVDSDHYEDGTVMGVEFYAMANGCIRTSVAVRPHSFDAIVWRDPKTYRHHHEPTVEDVLREFAERYLDYEGIPSAGRRGVGEALMDEYAAKLRLAEEEDE